MLGQLREIFGDFEFKIVVGENEVTPGIVGDCYSVQIVFVDREDFRMNIVPGAVGDVFDADFAGEPALIALLTNEMLNFLDVLIDSNNVHVD